MLIPLNVNLNNKKCLIIGAGNSAFRKIKKLLEYNANVKVIADEIKNKEIERLINKKKISFKNKKYEVNDTENFFLVVAATDNKELNNKIAEELDKKNILVNNISGLCNCSFPAILRRGDLQIAVSSDGASPLFSGKLRDKIGEIIPLYYNKVIELLKKYREKALKEIDDEIIRRIFFDEIVNNIINQDDIDLRIIKKDIKRKYKEYKKV